MPTEYIPERGDIAWVSLDPQAGHEQAGRRPVLVLSPARYNGKTGLMICCPVTNQIKGYPFEVVIASGETTGAVLADQVKSLDWQARKATLKERATEPIINDTLAKIKAILD
jgi:mRNA interferase MazF